MPTIFLSIAMTVGCASGAGPRIIVTNFLVLFQVLNVIDPIMLIIAGEIQTLENNASVSVLDQQTIFCETRSAH